MSAKRRESLVVGWREWIALPELGISPIKAKVDTGARTSSLHATHIREVTRKGAVHLTFRVCPNQRSRVGEVRATARLLGYRRVRSSNGIAELRPFVMTTIGVGGQLWRVEIALTSRDAMGFRMLLGRQALRNRAIVNPAHSFLQPKPKSNIKLKRKTPLKRKPKPEQR